MSHQDKKLKTNSNLSLSIEEKEIIQDNARSLDLFEFLEKYNNIPLSLLFSAFDAEFPTELLQQDPDLLLPLLNNVIHRKIAKRQKRPDINSFKDALDLISKSKNIIVLTGAGVSVSCGIPDFRSKNGIYSRMQEFDLHDPQEMFDLQCFKTNPSTFYSFAREIYPSHFTPSPSHMFIKLLQDKGKLLRNYTQNIDTLEAKAGITNLIQCHGSFSLAKCTECDYSVPGKEIESFIFSQTVPICPNCFEEKEGILKPSITFFGEKLPDAFDLAFKQDKEKVDLLLVMGSSLKVSPVADVKDKIPHSVPQILINMESLPHMKGFDVQLLGECDYIVSEICKNLEWKLEHENIQATDDPIYTIGNLPHIYIFKNGVEKTCYSESSDGDESTSECDSSNEGSESSESVELESQEFQVPPTLNLTPLPKDTTVVFILGGPGAGKGTQCSLLVKDFGMVHLSAGDLLREERNRPGSSVGELINNYIKDGQIVPMEITIALLHAAMKASECNRFLIDGFPRQLDQAEAFEREVCESSFILFLDCPEEEMERRLLKRGETSGRVDDNLESIKKRFRVFRDTSYPVIDAFDKKGKVKRIESIKPVEEVYLETKAVFQDFFK